MIAFQEFTLDNGLSVIVHEDPATPLAAVNLLYKVGSRDEDPEKTGFAHLFEHFMFEGSVNIPDFDIPLQLAGGENNAFTSTDITNYYDILPAAHLETAFWLESDRMLSLDFDQESLDTQKKVVCEEFKEHYINQPYGDVWHKLSALAYQVHPYRWPTIGLTLSHVEQATMKDVKAFFKKFYCPSNAILVVAGGVTTAQVKVLAEKWFGEIPAGEPVQRRLQQEPEQQHPRFLEVHADVPVPAIYKAYKMCGRIDADYYCCDLLRDVMSTGDSSRLYEELVKKRPMFSSISAYLTETIDAGLLIVEGKLNEGFSLQEADAAIQQCIQSLATTVTDAELQKVKNKMEAYHAFGETNILNRAMNLAYFKMLGDAHAANQELDKINAVTLEDIRRVANLVLQENQCATIYYLPQSQPN
ncbi:MAG: pitrilysin family protein [Chitinophagales bacterium]